MYVHIFQMISAASMTWIDTAKFSAIKSNNFLCFLFVLEQLPYSRPTVVSLPLVPIYWHHFYFSFLIFWFKYSLSCLCSDLVLLLLLCLCKCTFFTVVRANATFYLLPVLKYFPCQGLQFPSACFGPILTFSFWSRGRIRVLYFM
jgi:hypothetical protein